MAIRTTARLGTEKTRQKKKRQKRWHRWHPTSALWLWEAIAKWMLHEHLTKISGLVQRKCENMSSRKWENIQEANLHRLFYKLRGFILWLIDLVSLNNNFSSNSNHGLPQLSHAKCPQSDKPSCRTLKEQITSSVKAAIL